MRTTSLVLAALSTLLLFAYACSSGVAGREMQVAQKDDGCTPAAVDAKPGESLKFVVTNQTGKDYEMEGIEGAQLEEVIIPEGKTRDIGYTVPDQGGVYKIKCYVPGDVSTIMEIRAGNAGATTQPAQASQSAAASQGAANAAVSVGLKEYTVTPDISSVSAGRIRFDATNNSETMVHELAVLQVQGDGSFKNMGEVEGIDPGKAGNVTIDLPAGKYQLACLIVPGEAGSTVDHYKQGMHADFTVK